MDLPINSASPRRLSLRPCYTQGPTVSEQVLNGPKALVCTCQAWRPVSADGIGTLLDPWRCPGTIHTDPDVYFEASVTVLLEGEYNPSYPGVQRRPVP